MKQWIKRYRLELVAAIVAQLFIANSVYGIITYAPGLEWATLFLHGLCIGIWLSLLVVLFVTARDREALNRKIRQKYNG